MKSKLIVALDVDAYDEATKLVRDLAGVVGVFKVGSQLFTRTGPKIVEFIHGCGGQVFLDLKFHDIPNTVAKAVEAAAAWKVLMLTVHACGGAEMLQAAARPMANRPLILGVTVLTSVAGDVNAKVLQRAKLAKDCGLDGVIASPREIGVLRQTFGATFLIVTPGIRPTWAMGNDQRRTMTAAEAVAAGASYLVVGRPIIAGSDPVKAARRVLAEMASA
jgi:orotidine-5'-phosphate decarboxylase